MKKRVLFICTHNSARSQMAEGLMNHFHGDRFEAFSAGTEETVVKPHAIAALQEIGIDISHHSSKTLDQFRNTPFDFVVTVCDNAKENCPFMPGAANTIHMSFKDPSNETRSHQQKLAAFCRTRDEIKSWLETTFKDV